MNKKSDNELISGILSLLVQLKPRQLIGAYEILVSRESYLKGDKVVNFGARNAEQVLVFLEHWKYIGITNYDEFITDELARIKFKQSKWYLYLISKCNISESDKVKQFLIDLKKDLEIYIIHLKNYDITMLKNKYLE